MAERESWTIDSELDGIDLKAEDFNSSIPLKKVPGGDIFEASRAGDVERVKYLVETVGVNVNERDRWDSVALYYACLAGHLEVARMLLENGAICSEHTFDGDRCHYSALNLKVRKLLKSFEARPPPLLPLQSALRDTFLGCTPNQLFLGVGIDSNNLTQISGPTASNRSDHSHFPPDVIFYVQGKPIEAHRVILSARSPFFKKKFETVWRDRKEVRFYKEKLSYTALYSLIHFFYSDRLEIAVDDVEDLVRICRVCMCEELLLVIQKEWIYQTHADYKALRYVDNSQKRFILQGMSLPEQDRLPGALHQILQVSLAKSSQGQNLDSVADELASGVGSMQITKSADDLADVCIKVDKRIFRCHQVILASRSEYFKARLSRMTSFLEGKDGVNGYTLPALQESDLSTEAFEKMIEYMYTDSLKGIDPDQAEEMFDAASRYLLFPLKRVVAEALLPHLEMVSPAELCHWLTLSELYGVLKLREYCLDVIACNFETFANTREFRAMLLTLPPPSGDSSLRTTLPSAPGAGVNTDQGNLLDDLREKWLEAEAAELDQRDESAALFDKWLESLMLIAEKECNDDHSNDV